MSRARRLLRRDDEAVSEVLGFVLSFALSAMFLMISLTSFHTARNNSDAVVTAVELKAIADRVASHIVEAGLLGQEYPNATVNVTVEIPQTLNGLSYYVQATAEEVKAATTDGSLSATATTYKLDAVAGVSVSGFVYSTGERVIITYSLQDNGATRDIHLHGD